MIGMELIKKRSIKLDILCYIIRQCGKTGNALWDLSLLTDVGTETVTVFPEGSVSQPKTNQNSRHLNEFSGQQQDDPPVDAGLSQTTR